MVVRIGKHIYKLIALAIFIMIGSCKSVAPIIVDPTTFFIKTSIDLVNIEDDKVKVEIEVTNIDTDTISYFLPKIVPGTYQNNNYGNYIEDFKAFDSEGNPLYIQKYGSNRWKINNVRKLKKISYLVNDTFDSENTHNVFSPTGTNILKNKNFVLNLYAFVGYFDTLKETPYKILIKHPKILKASTSYPKTTLEKPIENPNYDVDYFVFKRYADLADSPIMYCIPDKVTFTINGVEVLLSVYSPGNRHKAARIMPQMERVIRAQRNFLAGINTTQKYSVLLYLSSAKKNDAKGFGALEHNTSTLVILPESISPKKLNESLTDVVSHEFFHIVTPLAIHSEEIHNFDYNNPKMSKHIWLYEGTTEYFSLLFQITQGLITKEEFLDRVIRKIESSKQFNDSMSFATMSKNILEEPYRSNYGNVYEKGALISMCLDIIMMEKSEGELGILNLIQSLSIKFGINTPFKDDKLIDIIEELSYPEISDFLKNHVIDNQPIDYQSYFNKIGVTYSTKNVPSSYFIHEQQPYVKGSETSREVIFQSDIPYNNFLNKLGVKGGDVLLGINNKTYTIKNIYDLFGDSKRWKIGNEITFKIKRKLFKKWINN